MKTTVKIELWTCPKCRRQFAKRNQSHSCKVFPLQKHFEGKEKGQALYDKLTRAIKKNIGLFKVDPVECCIHLVKIYTFAAIKVLKDKIRIDFTLPGKVKNKRLIPSVQMSANRYLYYVDISAEEEIDDELMGWLKVACQVQKETKIRVIDPKT